MLSDSAKSDLCAHSTNETQPELMHDSNSTEQKPSVQLPGVNIALIGEAGAGKQSLIERYYTLKAGIVPGSKHGGYPAIRVTHLGSDVECWGPQGLERFKAVPPTFYRNVDVMLLVVDISLDEKEIKNQMKLWLTAIPGHLDKRIPVVIVPSKADLVSPEVAKAKVKVIQKFVTRRKKCDLDADTADHHMRIYPLLIAAPVCVYSNQSLLQCFELAV